MTGAFTNLFYFLCSVSRRKVCAGAPNSSKANRHSLRELAVVVCIYSLKTGNDFQVAKALKASMISTSAFSATHLINERFRRSFSSSIIYIGVLTPLSVFTSVFTIIFYIYDCKDKLLLLLNCTIPLFFLLLHADRVYFKYEAYNNDKIHVFRGRR